MSETEQFPGRRLAWPYALCALLLALTSTVSCIRAPILSPKVPTPTPTGSIPSPATRAETETAIPRDTTVPIPTATMAERPSATDTPQPIPSPPIESATPVTASPTPTFIPSTATLTPIATATMTPTATTTLTPTAWIQLLSEPACDNPKVRITEIAFQERTIEFTGTAAIDNFWYYKFEYQGVQESEWHFIGELHETPVVSGTLFVWDTSILAPGQYRVNLIAVDKTGNYPPPCGIEIEILQ